MGIAQSYTVKVIDFAKGPKYAKRLGGRFDPQSKTWSIPQSETVDNWPIPTDAPLDHPPDLVAEHERILAAQRTRAGPSPPNKQPTPSTPETPVPAAG